MDSTFPQNLDLCRKTHKNESWTQHWSFLLWQPAQSSLRRSESDTHTGSGVMVPVTVRGGHMACQHRGPFSQTAVCGLSGGRESFALILDKF